MAKHDETEKKREEHEKLARGGKLEQPKEASEADETERKRGGALEMEHHGEKRRARGGSVDIAKIRERGHKKIATPKERKRVLKRGGRVDGEKPHTDMARRARGGATPEHNPLSGAGKVSSPPYVRMEQESSKVKGEGKDIGTHLGGR